MGIAASSAGRPGRSLRSAAAPDIKRLHARPRLRARGMQAALLAEQGVEGPPDVIEARDGFMQAFAFGRIDKARPIKLPPAGRVRHHRLLHQALRLLPPHPAGGRGDVRTCTDEKIAFDEIKKVEVETYKIATEHAHVPWDDFASAQLSFPYLMGLAARYRGVKLEHFDEKTRQGPGVRGIRREAHRDGAGGNRSALSEAAAGARRR